MVLEYEVSLDTGEKPATFHIKLRFFSSLHTGFKRKGRCGDLSHHSVSRMTWVSVTKTFSSGRYRGSVLYRC